MRVLAVAIVCLLSLLGPAAAEDEKKEPKKARPKPLTTEQAADAVLKAIETKDGAVLQALAAQDAPDPWLVADELCYRHQHDAAEAFARTAPRVDTETLAGYVASRRGQVDDSSQRERLATASAALLERRLRDALDALGPADLLVVGVHELHRIPDRDVVLLFGNAYVALPEALGIEVLQEPLVRRRVAGS